MVNWTIQARAESGAWASPPGNDVAHLANETSVKRFMLRWLAIVQRYGSTLAEQCYPHQAAVGLVWKGCHDDVTGIQPDFLVTVGPRGGIRWKPLL